VKRVDLSKYQNHLGFKNQLARFTWTICWTLLARPLPRRIGSGWKRILLRLFGAKLASTAVIYSSCRIYMPWKLQMGEYACLGPEVDCYNVDLIRIGDHTTVSQKAYLCTASHDITKSDNPLITAPIRLEDQAWIAADCFIGPGVTIGQGAVIAARAVVTKDVEPWTVVGGNPASFIKKRELRES
jgi:putative colanic acid biosynthesis acetyltransferase WcaF